MENPTKIIQTLPLDDVPKWCMEQVERRAMKSLALAQEELSHLLKQHHRTEQPDSTALLYHVEQCRQRLFTADMILQDVHTTIAAYRDYDPEQPIVQARDKMDEARAATSKLKKQEKEVPNEQ